MNQLWREVRQRRVESSFTWSVIDRWPTHPTFVRAVANRVMMGMEQFPEEVRKQVSAVFVRRCEGERAFFVFVRRCEGASVFCVCVCLCVCVCVCVRARARAHGCATVCVRV